MATLTPLETFENTVYVIGTELLRENVDIFNQHSNNAIVLKDYRIQGDFERTMALSLSREGLVRSRTPYSNRPLTPVNFKRTETNVVKLGLGTNPVQWTNDQFNWVLDNPKKAGVVIGKAIAEATLLTMLQYAIGGVSRNLAANSEVVTELGVQEALTASTFVKALRPQGDQAGTVALWLINSADYNDLILDNLKNENRLFEFGSVMINSSPTGQRFLITDNQGLIDANSRYIVGLKQNAVSVGNTSDMYGNLDSTNGQTNIIHSYQAEWTSGMEIMNRRYKTSDAMEGLSYAQITQASNWEIVENNPKAEAGVVIKRATA